LTQYKPPAPVDTPTPTPGDEANNEFMPRKTVSISASGEEEEDDG